MRISTPMRNAIDVARTLFREVMDDDIPGLAAQCAYALVFSMFPFLIFLVSLAAFMPQGEPRGPALSPELSAQVPGPVREIVEKRVEEVASTDRTGALTIALLVAIWSATAGATTLVSSINRAYDIVEKRSFVKRRLVGLMLTLAGAVLILLPSIWGWFGGVTGRVLERIGLGPAAVIVDWLRWPVILAGALFWLVLLFRVAPEGQKKFRWISPGAILAAVGFVATNRGFSLYVERATDMSVTYGALGGFIALLLWLYVTSFVLLLGAELNAVVDARKTKRRPTEPKRSREITDPLAPPSLGQPVRT